MTCPHCAWMRELLIAREQFCPPEWRLTPMEGRVVTALMGSRHGLTLDQIVEALWWDKEEPETPEDTARHHISRARAKLAKHGLVLTHGYMKPYVISGDVAQWRLKPLRNLRTAS